MNRPFDITYIWKAVPDILSGLGVTLQFLIGTIVIGGHTGIFGDLGKTQRSEMAAGNRP
jgi:ABC-type arginine/histidine transport system permease subunit